MLHVRPYIIYISQISHWYPPDSVLLTNYIGQFHTWNSHATAHAY